MGCNYAVEHIVRATSDLLGLDANACNMHVHLCLRLSLKKKKTFPHKPSLQCFQHSVATVFSRLQRHTLKANALCGSFRESPIRRAYDGIKNSTG